MSNPIIHISPEICSLPCSDIPSLVLLTVFRMASVPFHMDTKATDAASPGGVLPYLSFADQKVVGGLDACIASLQTTLSIDLDAAARLTPLERTHAKAHENMLSGLRDAIDYVWWIHPLFFYNVTRPKYARGYWAATRKGWAVSRKLQNRFGGLHDALKTASNVLDHFEQLLGDKLFFLGKNEGDVPSLLDAYVYAHLAACVDVHGDENQDGCADLRHAVLRRPSLIAFVTRIRERFFSDPLYGQTISHFAIPNVAIKEEAAASTKTKEGSDGKMTDEKRRNRNFMYASALSIIGFLFFTNTIHTGTFADEVVVEEEEGGGRQ
ncbi:mitochondrial Sam37-like protein [Andalucia godoyi]|uniref:Mitochondrial Sam37-like protein n=1 Tax=Andalucia godoyi TaxID=505711 RepID=A0A8K0AHU8_ANDGO|nr:mitochondrial Sam37-like protein [Andalucia godoyi]|eukprot:ANDGO_04096.mRNA.1 mitochondrial Sam37 homolog